MAKLVPALTSALILGLAAGCKDSGIVSYQVPKEVAASDAPASEALHVHWDAPAHWQPQPLGGVRQGSFLVAGDQGLQADMSVIAFPGDAGGVLANINRWRAQLGLSPFTAEELAAHASLVPAEAGEFLLVDFAAESAAGGNRERIIGAVIRHDDHTWFFKMTGEDGLVSREREAFSDFLHTVIFEDEHTEHLSAASSYAAGPETMLVWTAPRHWQARPPTPMRQGSFAISDGSGAEADLSISRFPGEAGGVLDNINRWRGQIQLAPISFAELPAETVSVEGQGFRFTVVDMTGPGGAGAAPRTLAAVLVLAHESWFFKLSGPDSLVGREKPAFLEFLQTVRTRY